MAKLVIISILLGVLSCVSGWRIPPIRAQEASVQTHLPNEQLDWPAYGGSSENTHYSRLTQIHRGNVKELQVAWSFDTEEEGGLQSSPIVVAGVLYGITPT